MAKQNTIQRTSINSHNIFTEWGVLLVKGAYKQFLAKGSYKEPIKNSARSESGTQIVDVPAQMRYRDEREFTISITTKQSSAFECIKVLNKFCDEVGGYGITEWRLEALGYSFFLMLTKNTEPSLYVTGDMIAATMQITLLEPNPDNRTEI